MGMTVIKVKDETFKQKLPKLSWGGLEKSIIFWSKVRQKATFRASWVPYSPELLTPQVHFFYLGVCLPNLTTCFLSENGVLSTGPYLPCKYFEHVARHSAFQPRYAKKNIQVWLCRHRYDVLESLNNQVQLKVWTQTVQPRCIWSEWKYWNVLTVVDNQYALYTSNCAEDWRRYVIIQGFRLLWFIFSTTIRSWSTYQKCIDSQILKIKLCRKISHSLPSSSFQWSIMIFSPFFHWFFDAPLHFSTTFVATIGIAFFRRKTLTEFLKFRRFLRFRFLKVASCKAE